MYIYTLECFFYCNLGKRRKDTFEEKKGKAEARKKRRQGEASTSREPVCTSCGLSGHSRATSLLCPNHQATLKERLKTMFPISYNRYTVSLTLKTFLRGSENDPNKLERFQETIKRMSSFLRNVVYRAQLFINYYILSKSSNPQGLDKCIFEKNFWYRVCRVVYQTITIDELQSFYPQLSQLKEAFLELQDLENVNLLLQENGPVGFGQVVSSACDTIATSYNSFYVENYETYIANYFIYKLKIQYPVGVSIDLINFLY